MTNVSEIRHGSGKRTVPKFVAQEAPNFSLVLGGPIFQLFRRSHLSGEGLELLYRRILLITLIAWLPLLPLLIFGWPLVAAVGVPLLRDFEAHGRLLVALPVLVAAELIVH